MAKTKSRQVTTARKTLKIKTAITISVESASRLGAAALKEGMSQSEVLEQLIDQRLSGYSVSLRGAGLRESIGQGIHITPVMDTDRPESIDHVSEISSVAA